MALDCQYQVSPAGAAPVKFMVTPGLAHCGEFDVGLAGSAGTEPFTVPVMVTSSFVHLVPLLAALVKYKRKVTVPILVKFATGNVIVGVCETAVAVPVAISAAYPSRLERRCQSVVPAPGS